MIDSQLRDLLIDLYVENDKSVEALEKLREQVKEIAFKIDCEIRIKRGFVLRLEQFMPSLDDDKEAI